MMVYLVLLIFLLFIPFLITKAILVYVLGMPLSQIRVWYYVSELQLPLEVAMGHFTMLTVLEGKKNYIGRFLYLWISFIARKLHVTRYVLPCPMKRVVVSMDTITTEKDGLRVEQDGRRTIVLRDSKGIAKVGPPLRRPPPGWDARNHDHQVYDNKITTRWAWGNEEQSDVEADLAARVIPTNWLLKTILLIGCSWLLISCIVIFLVIVPVSIGREIFYRLCLPISLHHDPVAFCLGMVVCYSIFSFTRRLSKNGFQQIVLSSKSIPYRTIRSLVELSLLWNLTHIGFKLLVMIALQPTTPLQEILTWSYLYRLWSAYHLMADVLLVLFINGGAQFLLLRIGQPDLYGIALWCQHIRISVERMCDGIVSGRFDEDSLQLKQLRNQLIWPFFDTIVIKGVSMVVGGWLSALMVLSCLSILTAILPTVAAESVVVSNTVS
jgi:hypothetical protein